MRVCLGVRVRVCSGVRVRLADQHLQHHHHYVSFVACRRLNKTVRLHQAVRLRRAKVVVVLEYKVHLTQCINLMVFESQPPPKSSTHCVL